MPVDQGEMLASAILEWGPERRLTLEDLETIRGQFSSSCDSRVGSGQSDELLGLRGQLAEAEHRLEEAGNLLTEKHDLEQRQLWRINQLEVFINNARSTEVCVNCIHLLCGLHV
jgi:hypothetical protein